MTFAGITLPTQSNTQGILSLDLLRSIVQAGKDLEVGINNPTKFAQVFGDFSTAATSKIITLFTSITEEAVHEVVIKLGTSFVGTGITVLTAKIGISGDTEKYLTSFDLLQAVSGTSNDEVTVDLGRFDLPVGTDIELLIEATGANLDQLSAGAVDIWISRSNLV